MQVELLKVPFFQGVFFIHYRVIFKVVIIKSGEHSQVQRFFPQGSRGACKPSCFIFTSGSCSSFFRPSCTYFRCFCLVANVVMQLGKVSARDICGNYIYQNILVDYIFSSVGLRAYTVPRLEIYKRLT